VGRPHRKGHQLNRHFLNRQVKDILDFFGYPTDHVGPDVVEDFAGLWTDKPPAPTIIWEGGPHEWAVIYSLSRRGHSVTHNWFSEPENNFILSYYHIKEPTSTAG